MSIEIEPEKAQDAAGQGPAAPGRARPWWMRPAIHTALVGAVLGGLGVFSDLFRQMLGRPVLVVEEEHEAATGVARFFRYSLDHKVVGIQYLVGMIIYFCTAGLFAMAIRTELLSPTYHVFNASTYIEVVGEHGMMMMMLMSSVVLGPFGNY